VSSWPRNQPCPYYGYIVGITTTPDIISQIAKDSRFFLICNPDTKNELPNPEWLLGLKTWIMAQGMPEDEVNILIQSISGLTKKESVEELNKVLSIPRN